MIAVVLVVTVPAVVALAVLVAAALRHRIRVTSRREVMALAVGPRKALAATRAEARRVRLRAELALPGGQPAIQRIESVGAPTAGPSIAQVEAKTGAEAQVTE
jgi:hypothetical protein